eukprot:scaffold314715_cov17-Tisochrysis_lutea.AAC.2
MSQVRVIAARMAVWEGIPMCAGSLKDGLQAHSVRAHTGNLSYLHIHIIVDCEGRWLISTPLRPSNLCDILYLLELPGSCFGGSGC